MNLFGIGFMELVFVLVIALIVLGPARMIEAARTLGRYARELQRLTSEVPRLLTFEDGQETQKPIIRREWRPPSSDTAEASTGEVEKDRSVPGA